jgi:hypothetical protein
VKSRSIQTLVSMLSLLAFAPFSVACAPEEERPRPPGSGSSERDGGVPPPPRTDFRTGPCTDGDSKECSIILGVHNDIVSCFHGTQVCNDGVWGPCADGEVIETAEDVPGVVGSGQASIDGGAPPAP